MQRIVQILYYLMVAASAIIFLLYYIGPKVPGTEGTNLSEPVITSFSLQYAYVVLALATVAALLFPVIQAIRDPKNIVRNISLFIGGIVVLGILYYFSSGKVLNIIGYEGSDNVPWVLKLVDTGLFAMYLSFVAAVLAIVYSEIRRYFL